MHDALFSIHMPVQTLPYVVPHLVMQASQSLTITLSQQVTATSDCSIAHCPGQCQLV